MNESNEDRAGNKLGGINPYFRDAAFNLALSLKIDLDKEATRTSRWFRAGVCQRYREAVLERLRRYDLPDLTAIALLVKVDKSVLSRWKSGQVSPDWDTLFFAGTAAQVAWDGALPSAGVTFIAGVCEAVSEIRTEILVREPLPCDPTVLALMRYIFFSKIWLRAKISQDAELLRRAADDARAFVSQRLGRPFKDSQEEMQRTIKNWHDPYLLFHLLIPFDWPM